MQILQNLNIISSKLLKNCLQNGIKQNPSKLNPIPAKSLWGYVAIAFNRVDMDRLQLVGPDRLCAEWVIKNGGAIRTVEAPNRLHTDYNSLPAENHRFKVKVIDGSGSSIMKIGLEHFKGCTHIDTVIFHQCKHLEEDALNGLQHLRNTLKVLQVSACDNISDDGLMPIGELAKLELLKIYEMRYVKDLDKVKQKLSELLPNCHMDIEK